MNVPRACRLTDPRNKLKATCKLEPSYDQGQDSTAVCGIGRGARPVSPALRERSRVVTARGRHGGPDRSAANDGECTIGTAVHPDNGTGGILNIGYCNGLIRSRDRYAGVMEGMTG